MPIYERMTIQGRGGALPSYQSQQAPYVPGQGVTARLSDAGGEIAGAGQQAKYKALAGLGKAMENAKDIGIKAYEDYEKAKVTDAYREFMDRMNLDLYGEGGILTRQGEDAALSPKDFEAAVGRHVQDVGKDMGLSAYAVESLKKTVEKYQTDTLPSVLKYSTTQTHKALVGRDEALADQYKSNAILNRDDRALYIADIAQGERSIADAKRRAGASEEEVAVAQAKYRSGAFYDMAVADLAVGKLGKAERFLKEKGLFTGEDAAKLSKKLLDTREANIKLILRRDEYEAKKAERILKKAGQVIEKDLTDTFIKGQLTLENVQEFRDFLSADDYQKWAERASSGPVAATKDNPAVYVELTEKLLTDGDVKSEAKQAFLDGKITKASFDKLTSGAVESENKQFFSYLSNALKPSEFNKNPAAGENYANAIRDFEQFLRKKPDATYQERDEAVRGIAKRYSLINTDKTTLALPMPRFFEGSRADINEATLQAAEDRAVSAFQSGMMTKEEFEEECARIEALSSAWNRLSAGNVQPPNSKR